jgi:hypothetical protein
MLLLDGRMGAARSLALLERMHFARFRSMTGDRSGRLARFVEAPARQCASAMMPGDWAREAEPLLAAVGIEDFKRGQFCLCSPPFQSGQPLPLSVAGSHVLKCMLWYRIAHARRRSRALGALWRLDVK